MFNKIIHFTPLEKSGLNKQKASFWHSLTGFIKYHNGFTIILALVLIGGTVVFADEDVRDKVIGQAQVETQGIDNTALLAADLENFDFALQINGVSEDENSYYLTYQYQTLAIQDNVWQTALTEEVLRVDKKELKERDLGLYAAEELSEVVEAQLAYLKEVQQREEKKGQTLVKQTTLYTGLIGLILDPKTKELPGYEPVVKSEEPKPEALTDRAKIIPQAVSEALAKAKAAEQARKAQLLPQILPDSHIKNLAGSLAGMSRQDTELTIPPISGSLPDQSSASDSSANSDQNPTADSSAQEPAEPLIQEPACQVQEEICDSKDNDCDGQIDEDGVCEPEPPAEPPVPESESEPELEPESAPELQLESEPEPEPDLSPESEN